jgi:DNA-directed RNA polymerase specialized sigma24 family protein
LAENADEEAFRRFVADVEPRLRRALVAKYGSEGGREATAAALGTAWERWSDVRSMENPGGYLYRVAQRSTRLRRPRVVFERPDAVETWVEPGLPAALASLSERQRMVVLLVHGAGWTHAEVGTLLGLSRSSVQSHLERALLQLRKALGVSARE